MQHDINRVLRELRNAAKDFIPDNLCIEPCIIHALWGDARTGKIGDTYFIWLNSGFVELLGSEELAAVLAHELGHVVHAHVPSERYPLSPEQEFAADGFTLHLLATIGVDARALLRAILTSVRCSATRRRDRTVRQRIRRIIAAIRTQKTPVEIAGAFLYSILERAFASILYLAAREALLRVPVLPSPPPRSFPCASPANPSQARHRPRAEKTRAALLHPWQA